MRGRKRIETLKRDNELVDIIFQHKGIENAIGTKELAIALSERGWKVKVDDIHKMVSKITLERRLPICGIVHKGYYWATSKQDILSCVNELQSKIEAMQIRCELLKSFICE